MKKIAENYFNGSFADQKHHEMLIIAERKIDQKTIEEIAKELSIENAYYGNNFLDCIHAYIHSPIQTKNKRKPIENKLAESAFQNIIKRMNIYFFIQKVDFDKLKRWPNSSIVSKD